MSFPNRVSASEILLLVPLLTLGYSHSTTKDESICDICQRNRYGTPFYCPIKADLPQCIFPSCPKICEVIENDPSKRVILKAFRQPLPKRPPHPVNLPKVPEQLASKFAQQGRALQEATKSRKKGSKYSRHMSLGRNVGAPLPANITPYNPETCEFYSPELRRVRPNSKYIEYRPSDGRYQINDIYKIAKMFGLVMAEFQHSSEWMALEMSSLLQTVSTYAETPDQPRIFYAIGMRDITSQEPTCSQVDFKYPSDNASITFAMLDPRVFGKSDEKCAVLSHIMASDQKQHLTTRLLKCSGLPADGKRLNYGLFMFPQGSMCHSRSEEDCGLLLLEKSDLTDAVFHNLIEIGQTLKRFIYLYSDQRTWSDAKLFCEKKGLRLLDLDPVWDDALRTEEVIRHFLREGKFNPAWMFWTAGRFDDKFEDGKFRWTTTNTYLNTQYKSQAPFPFAWWDDQEIISQDIQSNPTLHRRNTMSQPCVALALNPQDGGARPKLNFKAWYCSFPMNFLCYKEINATDNISSPDPLPSAPRNRHAITEDSCDPIPEASKVNQREVGNQILETLEPFSEETCSSKSLTAKRLTPFSKYVDYQPTESHYSVKDIKEHCVKLGLVPGEIRTQEDWDSVAKSNIGGIIATKGDGSASYFYVIGMDDSKEAEKFQYNSDGTPLTFSMFTTAGNSSINDRCSILQSVSSPTGSRGLVMQHINCTEGYMTDQKIAYGLCMFPRTWSCFKDSKEEKAAWADSERFTTIIPLGVTRTRSIFFNPVQRDWEKANSFCDSASLELIDFDELWQDEAEVIKIFRAKLERDGGVFQLTPVWTSGKLKGFYRDTNGDWTTTSKPISFHTAINYRWQNLSSQNTTTREQSIENACVEAAFHDPESKVLLRPSYCDLPKYFLCYRKTNKRANDPEQRNSLGITVIIDETYTDIDVTPSVSVSANSPPPESPSSSIVKRAMNHHQHHHSNKGKREKHL